jgi:tetratricopeptide (TPR) repeat protein
MATTNIEKSNQDLLFEFDSQALAQLAVGTSVFIACVLTLADVLPSLPMVTSVLSLVLRLVGDWIVVVVVWFIGFQALAQCLKLLSRGVLVTEDGIKLSRFDKLVPWSSIKAVSLEPNWFFTKLFSLKEPARRLTFLFHFEVKNDFVRKFLFPNFIPSFFFKRSTFDSLVYTVLERSQLLDNLRESFQGEDIPYEYSLTAVRQEDIEQVRGTSLWLGRQRLLVGTMILVFMFFFLGRKAYSYYCFNSGTQLAKNHNFSAAKPYFERSVLLEPTFAPGWNHLGQTNFKLAEMYQDKKNFEEARNCWNRAILLKLDYVEPRLNLTRLAILRGDLREADELLEHVARLVPDNQLYLLDRAELFVRKGQALEALKACRALLAAPTIPAEYKFKANCIAAMAELERGRTQEAARLLAGYSRDAHRYCRGEDLTYFYCVLAQIALAQGDLTEARNFINIAYGRQPHNPDVHLLLARFSNSNSNSQLVR